MENDKHNNKILVITTGGTIESFYDPEGGTPAIVPQEGESIIPEAIQHKFPELADHCDYKHYYALGEKGLQGMDSKHVSPDIMKNIAYYLSEHSEYNHIVIVHGTDTMPIHGRFLESQLKHFGVEMEDKHIIFTGAMEPLRNAKKEWRDKADGWENLNISLTETPTYPVSIAMGGKFHDVNAVNKLYQHQTKPDGTVVSVDGHFVQRTKEHGKVIIPLE